jgi:hypothetical protein
MKIRSGFVSNSSSSSFVIVGDNPNRYIDKDELTPYIVDNLLIVDDRLGETDFGWGPKTIYNTGSKIIFAYLQTLYAKNTNWLNMLKNVIKKYVGVKDIVWNIRLDCWDTDNNYDDNEIYGYIDHQSCATENKNIKIFENEEVLYNFIFNKSSCIELDNDNH